MNAHHAGVRTWTVLLAWGALGCASERALPPAAGEPCDASIDCNTGVDAGSRCGFVRVCIAGRCEQQDEAGVPASRTVSCR